jgi:glyoxylase-like metal-dependent hydrolase (beta-lactamase superfamily II)
MFKIGDIEVHRIEEHIIYEPMTLFPAFQQEGLEKNLGWLKPHYYDAVKAMFPTSVHSWLLKTPKLTILIDACGGNNKTRPISPRFHQLNTPYLDRLKAAGVTPEQVDYVILTHLHIDHVGWNTKLENGKWVPTFPNAKYLMSRVERDAHDPQRGAKEKPEGVNLPFIDSVQPILDAGLAQLVDGNEKLFDGMELVQIPGHTPGMIALKVHSRGQEALFAGDIAHQPIQIAYPDWSTKYCSDPKQAAASRRKVFDYCAETGSLLLPVHFGWPYCGRITRKGDDYSFVPFEREL